jgi:hypothetical protein
MSVKQPEDSLELGYNARFACVTQHIFTIQTSFEDTPPSSAGALKDNAQIQMWEKTQNLDVSLDKIPQDSQIEMQPHQNSHVSQSVQSATSERIDFPLPIPNSKFRMIR